MAYTIVLNANYEQVSNLFDEFIHPDFFVKFVERLNKFEQTVNKYRLTLRGTDNGAVANYLNQLKNKPVDYEDFKNKILSLQNLCDCGAVVNGRICEMCGACLTCGG